jgi:cystathionine beta-lyase/cystathionine gamma-synthase
VRVQAQQAGAQLVAEWLATHPLVDTVHFPSLPGCDPKTSWVLRWRARDR